jgi:hypothetical protein
MVLEEMDWLALRQEGAYGLRVHEEEGLEQMLAVYLAWVGRLHWIAAVDKARESGYRLALILNLGLDPPFLRWPCSPELYSHSHLHLDPIPSLLDFRVQPLKHSFSL